MLLKHKFLAIGATTSLLAIVLAVMSMIGVAQFTGLIIDSEIAFAGLRNHMTGDMMHDGLRSDVYRALYAAENAPQDREEVLSDVKEHAQLFRERMATNRKLDLPENVLKTLGELVEPLEVYIGMSETIADAAFKNRDKAVELLPNFDKRFSDLEGAMVQASDAIESVVLKATEHAHSIATIARFVMIAALIAAIVIGAGITIYMWRSLALPLVSLAGSLRRLGDGDIEVSLVESNRKDEIGDMMRAATVFRDNANKRLKLEETAEAEQEQRVRRQQRVDELIASFRSQSDQALQTVAANAGQMEGAANALSELSATTSIQVQSASSASDEASGNVQAVAAASEQLTASIGEISAQIGGTSELINEAADAATDSDVKISSLAESVRKIGDVVSIIRDIAEQTNLLALNATIEAARAGEAGKGFAVVASEVKELAEQTGKATEEISDQIGNIQGETSQAVISIQAIAVKMADVNENTTAIAAAVEQQNASTGEISRNVQAAAGGAQSVTDNVAAVSSSINETAASADQVLTASRAVAEQAQNMQTVVAEFLENVAAA